MSCMHCTWCLNHEHGEGGGGHGNSNIVLNKSESLAGRFSSRVTTVTSLPSPTPLPHHGGLPSQSIPSPPGLLPFLLVPFPPGFVPLPLVSLARDTSVFIVRYYFGHYIILFSIVRNSIITVRGRPRQGRRACVLLIINALVEFILPDTRQKHYSNGRRPASNEWDTVT